MCLFLRNSMKFIFRAPKILKFHWITYCCTSQEEVPSGCDFFFHSFSIKLFPTLLEADFFRPLYKKLMEIVQVSLESMQ